MKSTIRVQNLKCGGCANSIKKKLGKLDVVTKVEVVIDSGEIRLEHTGDIEIIEQRLMQLGYPTTDATNGFTTKAKSFVSCGIGRLSNVG